MTLPTHLADRAGTLAILLLHTQIEGHDDETQRRAGHYTATLLRFQRLSYLGMALAPGLVERVREEMDSVREAMAEYCALHPTRGN